MTSATSSVGHTSSMFVSLSTCRASKLPLIEKVLSDVTRSKSAFSGLLLKIKERSEIKTEILQAGGEDIGFISYMRDLQSISIGSQRMRCLEVKAFSLFNPNEHGRRGWGTRMIERIEDVARNCDAEAIAFKITTELHHLTGFFRRCRFDIAPKDSDTSYESLLLRRMPQKRRAELQPSTDPLKDSAPSREKIARVGDSSLPGSQIRMPVGPPAAAAATSERSVPSSAIHLGQGKHQLTLKKPYIDPIRRGIKSVEGRIAVGAPTRFRVGDTIRFFYPQDERDDVVAKIIRITHFKGFKEMLTETGFKKCIPAANTLDEALAVYNQIPGYTARASQHGVLAIHLEPVTQR